MSGSHCCKPGLGGQGFIDSLDLVMLQEGSLQSAPCLDDTFGYRGYRLLTILKLLRTRFCSPTMPAS